MNIDIQRTAPTDEDAMSFQSALSDSFLIETVDDDDDNNHSSFLPSKPQHDDDFILDRPPSPSFSEPTRPPSSSTVSGPTSQRPTNASKSNNRIAQHLCFNQDRSCIAMGLDTGYRIHTLPRAQDFVPNHSDKIPPSPLLVDSWNKTHIHQVALSITEGSSVVLCSMLHETSLFAIVQHHAPRILSLIHAKQGSILHQLSFQCAVLRVEMNRSTLVVLTSEGRLHCFSFFVSVMPDTTTQRPASASHRLEDIHLIHRYSIHLLAPNENIRLLLYSPNGSNPGAFFDLSSHCFHGHSWLVTKSESSMGSISLYDTSIPMNSEQEGGGGDGSGHPPVGWILTRKAHDHSITRIAVGTTIFATASQKGTMIRVFRIPDGDLIHQLSRGTTPCPILSLILNPNATVLAVCSSHNTIHIFHLHHEDKDQSIFRHVLMNRFTSWKKNPSLDEVPSLSQSYGIQRPVSRIHLNRVIGTTQHVMTLLDVESTTSTTISMDSNSTILLLCTENGEMLQYGIAPDGIVNLIHTHNVLHS